MHTDLLTDLPTYLPACLPACLPTHRPALGPDEAIKRNRIPSRVSDCWRNLRMLYSLHRSGALTEAP